MASEARDPREAVLEAARNMDWMQVVLNGGPPCFALMDEGHFCGRAERWFGHPKDHHFVSLEQLLDAADPLRQPAGGVREEVANHLKMWRAADRKQDSIDGHGPDIIEARCRLLEGVLQPADPLRQPREVITGYRDQAGMIWPDEDLGARSSFQPLEPVVEVRDPTPDDVVADLVSDLIEARAQRDGVRALLAAVYPRLRDGREVSPSQMEALRICYDRRRSIDPLITP